MSNIIKIILILLLKRFKGVSRGFQGDFKVVSRGKLLDSTSIGIYIFVKTISVLHHQNYISFIIKGVLGVSGF